MNTRTSRNSSLHQSLTLCRPQRHRSARPGLGHSSLVRTSSRTRRPHSPDPLILPASCGQRRRCVSHVAESTCADAKFIRQFRRAFESGVLNEKNIFGRAGIFSRSSCFLAAIDAGCEFFAYANSVTHDSRYSSGRGSTAPASAIPHRHGEGFARTNEGSASCA
jgi:hypothetical protein